MGEYSGGVPRLINLIADRSLLAGMATGAGTIDREVVGQAVRNLQLSKPASGNGFWGRVRALFAVRRAAVVVGLSLLLALALVLIVNQMGS